jgi:hypothetical protein
VPISELVFGTLTQNRSSLEPARRALRTAVPLLVILRMEAGRNNIEFRHAPQDFWGPVCRRKAGPSSSLVRHNLLGSRVGSSRACTYGTRSTMQGGPAIAANPRQGSRLLRFCVKVPNTSSEIGTTLSRARACGSPRQAKCSNCAGSIRPASGDASSATPVGPDILPTQLWVSTWAVGTSSYSYSSSTAVYRSGLWLGD